MNPHENQVVVELTTPSFGFDDKGPAYYPTHAGTWARAEHVDPAPAYSHDAGLVRQELAHLRTVAPLTFPLAVVLLSHEVTSRTNGHYCDDRAYTKDGRVEFPVGIIVLSGKRIPIHPAMTRYLVAHEYGHGVEYHLARLRKVKDRQILEQYVERVRPDAERGYGCGKWHSNVGELFANDFRIPCRGSGAGILAARGVHEARIPPRGVAVLARGDGGIARTGERGTGRLMPEKNPALVALRWRDAHGSATALYEIHELPHKATEITTYGLLLRQDEEGISIAAEDCGGGCYRGVTFVPKALIVECRPVKPPRTRRAERRHGETSTE